MNNKFIKMDTEYIIKLDSISACRMYENKLHILLDGKWISFDGETTYLTEIYELLLRNFIIVNLYGESV